MIPALVLAGLLHGSVTEATDGPRVDAGSATSHRLCGTRWLAQARLEGDIPPLPDGVAPLPAARPLGSGQTIDVGTQLVFPLTLSHLLVDATCRYRSDRLFIFVEDSEWDENGGSIFQSHVDVLAQLFESSTPADSTRGIYQLTTEAFGDVPDVDGIPQIFLLIADLRLGGLVGYFDAGVAMHAVPEYRRDVIHLSEFHVRREAYLARGTLAHEFQHLIHWNHDPDEEVWIDEGLSGYAEELVGYPEADPAAVPDFLEHPNTPLTSWPFEVQARNYGVTYLYASYLAERYGPDAIRAVVAAPRNGIFGIDQALDAVGEDFESTWMDWAFLTATGGEDGGGYTALAGRRSVPFAVGRLPLSGVLGFASRWAMSPILFRTPGNVAIDFDGDDAGRFRVTTAAWRDGVPHSEEVSLDALNQGRSLSADADSVLLLVGRTSIGGGNFSLDARAFVPTAIAETPTPITTALGEGFPNPFNSAVQIPFRLDAAAPVTLEIFAVSGQRVWAQHWPQMTMGEYRVTWDGSTSTGRPAATGSYIVRLRAGGNSFTTKIALLR